MIRAIVAVQERHRRFLPLLVFESDSSGSCPFRHQLVQWAKLQVIDYILNRFFPSLKIRLD